MDKLTNGSRIEINETGIETLKGGLRESNITHKSTNRCSIAGDRDNNVRTNKC